MSVDELLDPRERPKVLFDGWVIHVIPLPSVAATCVCIRHGRSWMEGADYEGVERPACRECSEAGAHDEVPADLLRPNLRVELVEVLAKTGHDRTIMIGGATVAHPGARQIYEGHVRFGRHAWRALEEAAAPAPPSTTTEILAIITALTDAQVAINGAVHALVDRVSP